MAMNVPVVAGLVVISASALAGFVIEHDARADSIVLSCVKDTTLIDNGFGDVSNGAGDGIFSGQTGPLANNTNLRALLAFDLTSIPPGSVVNDASLTLRLVMSRSGFKTHTLHKVLADWGEAGSSGFGGLGAPAQPGDATWTHRFYPTTPWTTAGGDFSATDSATQSVDLTLTDFVWTSPQLVADVQSWVNDPCANFGWMLIGDETASTTAKKFASRDWFVPAERPRLAVNFSPAPVCLGDVTHSHAVNIDDLLMVIGAWGQCSVPCNCPADIDQNHIVNIDDLLLVIGHWGGCP